MRINNNIMAMNAHRQYGINNSSIAKSTEKLSSGFRINRAGDDAAGLAISEKMRAQIRGLTMASKNSADAISMVQTAEGALQESHNILQRMRELSVQSASDTNETSIDRDALDKEFQALKAELDETARTTRFNDMGLIDGTYASNITSASASASTTGVNSVWASANMAAGDYTVSITSTLVSAAVSAAAGTGTLDPASVTDAITNSNGATVKLEYAAPTSDEAKTSSANGVWKFGFNKDTGMYTMSNQSTGEIMTAAAAALDSATSPSQTLDFGKAGTITLTATAGSLDVSDISGVTAGITVTRAGATTAKADEYVHTATFNGESVKLETGMDTLVFKDLSVKLNGPLNVDNTVASSPRDNIDVTVSKGAGKNFVVQTGANQHDELSINIDRMDSQTLGVSTASVSNRLNASAAITQVNTALNLVSSQRAGLGALQNRLGHKIANLDTSAENLQAAESRIRDVDMAKEMTTFTKNNILFQASTAMLAQANSAPQGVLQLLQ